MSKDLWNVEKSGFLYMFQDLHVSESSDFCAKISSRRHAGIGLPRVYCCTRTCFYISSFWLTWLKECYLKLLSVGMAESALSFTVYLLELQKGRCNLLTAPQFARWAKRFSPAISQKCRYRVRIAAFQYVTIAILLMYLLSNCSTKLFAIHLPVSSLEIV